MSFQKLREDISKWSDRLSRRRSRVESPPLEPQTVDTPAAQSTTGSPSPSSGSSQDSAGQHPAVRPLSAKLCPRPSNSEASPPLWPSPAAWLRGDSLDDMEDDLDDPEVVSEEAIEDGQSQQASSTSGSRRPSNPYSWSRADWDYTIHSRPPVIQEESKPHVHTIHEPHRTREIHFHEHRYIYQPVIDPNPYVLPE